MDFDLPKRSLKILVSGTQNLFGEKLITTLLNQGVKVFVVNYNPEISESLRERFRKNPNLIILRGSVIDKYELEKSFSLDYIFDLNSFETLSSLKYSQLLAEGTQNLLDIAVDTAADYIFGEDDSLKPLRWPREAKALNERKKALNFAEVLIGQYAEELLINSRVIKLADLYTDSYDQNPNSFIGRAFLSYIQEEKLPVVNDGLDRLHPIYLNDAVFTFLRLAFAKEGGQSVYKAVSETPLTVGKFLDHLNQALSPKISFEYVNVASTAGLTLETQDQKLVKIKSSISLEAAIRGFVIDYLNKNQQLITDPSNPFRRFSSYSGTDDLSGESLKQRLTANKEKPDLQKKPLHHRFRAYIKTKVSDPLLYPVYSLKSSLAEVFQKRKQGKARVTHPEHYQPPPVRIFISPRLLMRRFFVVGIVALILMVSVIPVSVSFGGALFGSWLLVDSARALEAGDKEKALQLSHQSGLVLRASRSELNSVKWLFNLANQDEPIQNYDNLLYVNQNLASVINKTASVAQSFQEIFKNLAKEPDPANNSRYNQIIKSAYLNLESAAQQLGYAQVVATNLNDNSFPKQLPVRELKSRLIETTTTLKQAQDLTALASLLLGMEKEMSYLVLLQNNGEIRPTGGFIGSYAIIKVKDGSIQSLKVDDIYNLDGRLNTVYSAPAEIKKYLNLDRLYIRDANWDPDFKNVGFQISEMYTKATGDQVDVVLGTNLEVFEKLLDIVGPIKIPDYEEEITSANFLQKAQHHAEVRFFPGSTGKKDFLGEAAQLMLERFFKLDRAKFAQALLGLQASLKSRDLLLFSKSAQLHDFFAGNSFSGELAKLSKQEPIAQDYFYVVDANVGVNKANLDVTEQIDYTATFDREGNMNSKITLNYKHNSNSEAWPSGVYKDYVRVYIPLGAQDVTIQSDSGFVTDFKTTTKQDRTEVGFYVEVRPNSGKKMIVNYLQPKKITRSHQTFHILVQKQPGKNLEQLNLRYEFPAFVEIKSTNANLTVESGVVGYRGKQAQDLNFDIGITVNWLDNRPIVQSLIHIQFL